MRIHHRAGIRYAIPPHVGRVLAATALGLWLAASPVKAQSNPLEAGGVEWIGGTAGSAAGVTLGLLIAHPGRCDGEDVGCMLERLGLIGLMSAVTAPVGAWSAGEWADSAPHAAGAALGGIAGVGAGVGALRLLSELGMEPRGFRAVVVYVAAQGLFTAAGSRLGAELAGE